MCFAMLVHHRAVSSEASSCSILDFLFAVFEWELHRNVLCRIPALQVVSLRRRLMRYEPDDEDAKREDEEDDSATAAEGKD